MNEARRFQRATRSVPLGGVSHSPQHAPLSRGMRFLCMGVAAGLLAAGWGLTPVGAEYQAKGRRDPFIPLLDSEGRRIHPPGVEDEEGSPGLGNLLLQGILFDPKAESYAVINGQVVREQEELEGVRVVRIEPDSVTVSVEGQSHRLTVQEPQPDPEASTEETTTP